MLAGGQKRVANWYTLYVVAQYYCVIPCTLVVCIIIAFKLLLEVSIYSQPMLDSFQFVHCSTQSKTDCS